MRYLKTWIKNELKGKIKESISTTSFYVTKDHVSFRVADHLGHANQKSKKFEVLCLKDISGSGRTYTIREMFSPRILTVNSLAELKVIISALLFHYENEYIMDEKKNKECEIAVRVPEKRQTNSASAAEAVEGKAAEPVCKVFNLAQAMEEMQKSFTAGEELSDIDNCVFGQAIRARYKSKYATLSKADKKMIKNLFYDGYSIDECYEILDIAFNSNDDLFSNVIRRHLKNAPHYHSVAAKIVIDDDATQQAKALSAPPAETVGGFYNPISVPSGYIGTASEKPTVQFVTLYKNGLFDNDDIVARAKLGGCIGTFLEQQSVKYYHFKSAVRKKVRELCLDYRVDIFSMKKFLESEDTALIVKEYGGGSSAKLMEYFTTFAKTWHDEIINALSAAPAAEMRKEPFELVDVDENERFVKDINDVMGKMRSGCSMSKNQRKKVGMALSRYDGDLWKSLSETKRDICIDMFNKHKLDVRTAVSVMKYVFKTLNVTGTDLIKKEIDKLAADAKTAA